MKETIHDYLLRRLGDFRGQHKLIAAETGVPYSTLIRIQSGQCSPRLAAVQPILDWFAAYDAQLARRKPSRSPGGRRRTDANILDRGAH
jgi:hypothetical protein